MSTSFVIIGAVLALLGGAVCYGGWKRRERHRLIEGTETTAIRDVKREGTTELEGTIAGTTAGTERFDAPISGDSDTVLAAWRVEEWDERGKNGTWNTLARGIYAEPFVLEDHTGSVEISVGDRVDQGSGFLDMDRVATDTGTAVDGVSCEFEEFRYLSTDAESEPPRRIRAFVAGERGLSEQSGSLTNLVDIGNAHGDRRYHEGTLSVGDDAYVLGSVEANANATRPLHPEDVTVTPTDGEPFVVSDQSESALRKRLENYRLRLVGGGAVLVVGLSVAVAGALGVL